MKIAVVVPSLLPTGPVRVALDQAGTLRQHGHQVTLFYFDLKPGAVEDAGAVHIQFAVPFLFAGFDVVHSHGLRPDAYVWWHRPKVPTVTTMHNYAAEDLGYLYPRPIAKLAAWAWKQFTKLHNVRIALSSHMQEYYIQHGWQQPIAVVPNSRPAPTGAPSETLAAQISDFAQGRIVLGNVSHYTPRKGITQIIDLLAVWPAAVLVHIGSNTEALVQYAHDKGVQKQCLWLGPHANAAQQLVLFDVFVMPSYSEGFPLALLEAIAAGVPVVVSDLPVFEALFPREAVARFQLGSCEGLRDAITTTLATRAARAAKANQLYQRLFTPEAVGGQLLAVYAALCGTRNTQ